MPETKPTKKPAKIRKLSPSDIERRDRVTRFMQRPGFTGTWHDAEIQIEAEDAAWAAYRKANK
jgi:hypothetical protein